MVSNSSQDIYAETIAVFEHRDDPFEPLTTPEVADELDANRRTVYKRLKKLVSRGELETKETGSNSRVWWRPRADSTVATVTQSDAGHDEGVDPLLSPPEEKSDREPIPSKPGKRQSGDPRQTRANSREILEKIPDGVTLHDPTDGTIIDANQQFCELLGYDRDDFPALDFEAVHADVPPYTLDRAEQYLQRAAAEGPQTFEWLDETKDGDKLPVEVHLRRTTIDGEERILAVVRDITERKERERKLRETNRQLQAVLDTVEASIFIKDTEGRYQLLNEECKEMLGLDLDAEVVGLTDDDLFPAGTADQYRADDRRVLEHGETIEVEEEVPTPEGTQINLTLKSPLFDADGEPAGVCAVSTDITDRKERERELQARSAAMEASIDGMAILDANGEYIFVNQSHADIYGYDDPDSFLGETWRMCYDEDELARFEDDIMPELSTEGAWRGEVIGQRKDGTTFPQELSLSETDDGSIVCVVRDITDRREDERELEHQREQLAALNELNDVVRGITDTVIDQSTRTEIEQAVCDRLAEAGSYQFAWFCAVDSAGQLEPRQEAGVDGYLDEISLSVDPEDPTGRGPTGKAVRTQEMQINQHVLDDPDFEPWHEHARQYGYRSSAAIPVVYEDTLYGVIGVYSQRPDAFAEREREVVGQLGEVVGHAIAAVDRKRALMNDEIVELEFRMHDIEGLDLLDASDGTVILERMVPIGDGSYLAYGVATDDMMETVTALVDAESTPHSGPLNIIESTDEETRFELRLIESRVLSTVVAQGGYLNEARIEDRSYSIQIHLPPSANIRTITDTVTDIYPGAEIVTRRQTTRSTSSPQQIMPLLADRLTERQMAALEAGYFAGFFEWPRAGSGEDVAESLGIGASTFHQHVRKAEKKLLDIVFDDV